MKLILASLITLTALTFAMPQIASASDDGETKQFVKKRYSIDGTAKVVTRDGKTHLIFSNDFKTKNGPDLKVYLTKKPVSQLTGEDVALEGEKLGVLKSNKGEQSYILPDDINTEDYKSVVIHCEAFTVLWGGFDL